MHLNAGFMCDPLALFVSGVDFVSDRNGERSGLVWARRDCDAIRKQTSSIDR